jgi:hypothetical protein
VLYWINGGPTPPWYYTVGLNRESAVPELVLAGTTVLLRDAVQTALNELADKIRTSDTELRPGSVLDAGDIGLVELRAIHPSWATHLLLGAIDYYDGRDFEALQIVPPTAFVDTPNLAEAYDADREPSWRWLTEPWPFAIPPETLAITDTSALAGRPITVVNHNRPAEDDVPWEFYATQEDLTEDILRLVPVGTLVAIDPTLADVLDLEPGTWAERETETGSWDAYTTP